MKINTIALFGLLGIMLFTTSCSKKLTPFTERLHDEYGWQEKDLKKIQFYLSNDIVLQRNIGLEESRITNGKIKVIDGRDVEVLIFEKGTPGVLLFSPKTNRLGISFEEGSDKFLMFGPSPKVNGRYVLLAKDWNRRTGNVTYNGKTYKTNSESALASLLVDLDKHKDVDYSSKKVKGRKL